MTSIKQTEEAVYDFMSDEEHCLFNENDVNLIAQEVDADIREIPLDDKIYDSLTFNKDARLETL